MFYMLKRHLFSVLFLFCVAITSVTFTSAQSAPSALRSPITLTVGGTASAFDPDYVQHKLIGIGAFVDLDIQHHLGVEAEGRWQRFRELDGISQDNYLVGPRYRFRRIWKAQPYAKVLGGFSNMNFENGFGTGRFTTFAFGGGLDIKVNRKWSVRVPDFEYQYWPSFLNGSLHPYGASAGISYRVF
jgi:opacity protein-like surface antigen